MKNFLLLILLSTTSAMGMEHLTDLQKASECAPANLVEIEQKLTLSGHSNQFIHNRPNSQGLSAIQKLNILSKDEKKRKLIRWKKLLAKERNYKNIKFLEINSLKNLLSNQALVSFFPFPRSLKTLSLSLPSQSGSKILKRIQNLGVENLYITFNEQDTGPQRGALKNALNRFKGIKRLKLFNHNSSDGGGNLTLQKMANSLEEISVSHRRGHTLDYSFMSSLKKLHSLTLEMGNRPLTVNFQLVVSNIPQLKSLKIIFPPSGSFGILNLSSLQNSNLSSLTFESTQPDESYIRILNMFYVFSDDLSQTLEKLSFNLSINWSFEVDFNFDQFEKDFGSKSIDYSITLGVLKDVLKNKQQNTQDSIFKKRLFSLFSQYRLYLQPAFEQDCKRISAFLHQYLSIGNIVNISNIEKLELKMKYLKAAFPSPPWDNVIRKEVIDFFEIIAPPILNSHPNLEIYFSTPNFTKAELAYGEAMGYEEQGGKIIKRIILGTPTGSGVNSTEEKKLAKTM